MIIIPQLSREGASGRMDIKELGEALLIPPFRGRISSRFNHPELCERIADCEGWLNEPSTRILLDGRNRVGCCPVKVADGEVKDIVIKAYRIQGINKLKSLLLPSKAFKAWRGSCVLAQKGISTPAPVAYLEARKGKFLEQSFFLTELVEGVEEIRELFPSLAGKELEVLLMELAGYLSRCREEGILHRDLSDGNILVKRKDEGGYWFYLIDTNRIRHRKRVGQLGAVKSLIRLGIPSFCQRYFLQEYLRPRRLNNFLWFWYKGNKHVFTWYMAFKRCLRLRDIANKLKIQ